MTSRYVEIVKLFHKAKCYNVHRGEYGTRVSRKNCIVQHSNNCMPDVHLTKIMHFIRLNKVPVVCSKDHIQGTQNINPRHEGTHQFQ